jgi:hypothetical protein
MPREAIGNGLCAMLDQGSPVTAKRIGPASYSLRPGLVRTGCPSGKETFPPCQCGRGLPPGKGGGD